MAAYVKHRFKGDFVIDETQLRRVNEMVAQRLATLGVPAATITVHRMDSFTFSSQNIDEVCAEENSPALAIRSISFDVRADDFGLHLVMDGKEGVNLDIEGADRDGVLLMFSDLRSYFEKEVMRWKWIDRQNIRFQILFPLMFATAVMFGLLGTMIWTMSRVDGLDAALKSTDLAEKLNYLISKRETARGAMWPLMIAIALFLSMAFGAPTKIFRFLYPGNMFLLGRNVQWFETRSKLRGNLFWSVLVAAVIGVLTTLALKTVSA